MKDIFSAIFDFIVGLLGKLSLTKHYDRNTWVSQLKAKRSPWSSCFSHSTAWFLQNAGVKCTPDEVTAALNDDPVYLTWAKSHYGVLTASRFPGKMQMLWELQLYFINRKLMNTGNSAIFTAHADMASIKTYLDRGPVIVSTTPRYKGRTLGHVMLIVGKTETGFIIDDPFGDFRDEYKTPGKSGDDLHVMFEEFSDILGGLAIHYLKTVGA